MKRAVSGTGTVGTKFASLPVWHVLLKELKRTGDIMVLIRRPEDQSFGSILNPETAPWA